MKTAAECRKSSMEYRLQAHQPGITPRMAKVLENIANSFSGLASQYEILKAIATEEHRPDLLS